MTSSQQLLLLVSVVLLAWAVTESLASPAQQVNKRVKRTFEDEGDSSKGKGDTAKYIKWGNTNMAAVQGKLDAQFVERKKKGDLIEKAGDKSRQDNVATQKQMETSMDKSLESGMQSADKEIAHAVSKLGDGNEDAGDADDDDVGTKKGKKSGSSTDEKPDGVTGENGKSFSDEEE